MKVYEKDPSGTYIIRKRIALGEGYFSGPRLKLTDIKEIDATVNTIKKHNFYYHENPSLPEHTSLKQDWWGFYNGRYNTSLIKTETINFEGFNFNVGGANREPDSAYMKACILEKIVYPTGGYTFFNYEPHFYGAHIMAGGLRVSKIRDFDGSSATPVTKIYKYGTGESGDGLQLVPAEGLNSSKQISNFTWWATDCSGCCTGSRMTIKGQPAYD